MPSVYLTLLPNQIKVTGGGADDVTDIGFEALIQKGLRAKLNMQSIVTGQLGVDLDFRPNTPLVLAGSPNPSIPEIPTVKSDFDVLKDQLGQLPFRQIADGAGRRYGAALARGRGPRLVASPAAAGVRPLLVPSDGHRLPSRREWSRRGNQT